MWKLEKDAEEEVKMKHGIYSLIWNNWWNIDQDPKECCSIWKGKLQILKHWQKSGSLKRGVWRKNSKEGKCQNKYFPSPLKMILVKEWLATILIYLGDLQKSSEEPRGWQATFNGVVQFERPKKVPYSKNKQKHPPPLID